MCYLKHILGYVFLFALDSQIAYLNVSPVGMCAALVFITLTG